MVIDVPVYRIDVQRDVDVIEDILRIYGYNNVEFSDNVKSNLSYQTPTDRSYKLQNLISEQLCGCGFNEILNNSLTRSAYYDNPFHLPGFSLCDVDESVECRSELHAPDVVVRRLGKC